MTKIGGTVTYSVNYYDMGKLTAKKSIEILENIKEVGDIPLEIVESYDFVVNTNMIKTLGIKIPDSLNNL